MSHNNLYSFVYVLDVRRMKIYSGFDLFKSAFDSLNKNKIKLKLASLN